METYILTLIFSNRINYINYNLEAILDGLLNELKKMNAVVIEWSLVVSEFSERKIFEDLVKQEITNNINLQKLICEYKITPCN